MSDKGELCKVNVEVHGCGGGNRYWDYSHACAREESHHDLETRGIGKQHPVPMLQAYLLREVCREVASVFRKICVRVGTPLLSIDTEKAADVFVRMHRRPVFQVIDDGGVHLRSNIEDVSHVLGPLR